MKLKPFIAIIFGLIAASGISLGGLFLYNYANNISYQRKLERKLFLCDNNELFKVGHKAFNNEDYNTALTYFTAAANKYHEESCMSLGLMYYDGVGVEQNSEKAFFYFKRAAELGNIDARYYTGLFLAEGIGTEENFFQGYRWLELAANEGHPSAAEIISEIENQEYQA